MDDVLKTSIEWKEKANQLLDKTELVADLAKFGEVVFTGAYEYDLMMHGDIDISVIRDESFSTQEVFEIFRELYFKGKFRSYFIKGDWDDPREGVEFPNGYYVGLKEKVGSERWKIDLWFVSKTEFDSRDVEQNNNFSEDQRKIILECKQYRNQNKIAVTGQEIYTLVASGECVSLEDFKNRYK